VIGVMAREFSYPHGNDFPGQYQFASLPRTEIWLPAALTPKQQSERVSMALMPLSVDFARESAYCRRNPKCPLSRNG
jgi:hypothetical protein